VIQTCPCSLAPTAYTSPSIVEMSVCAPPAAAAATTTLVLVTGERGRLVSSLGEKRSRVRFDTPSPSCSCPLRCCQPRLAAHIVGRQDVRVGGGRGRESAGGGVGSSSYRWLRPQDSTPPSPRLLVVGTGSAPRTPARKRHRAAAAPRTTCEYHAPRRRCRPRLSIAVDHARGPRTSPSSYPAKIRERSKNRNKKHNASYWYKTVDRCSHTRPTLTTPRRPGRRVYACSEGFSGFWWSLLPGPPVPAALGVDKGCRPPTAHATQACRTGMRTGGMAGT
jgi:hypothetical protein